MHFDEMDILNRLRKLKTDKSAGPDGLRPGILQRCAEQLAGPVKILYDRSFSSGVVPPDWKQANVTAIYKKGDKNEAGNYRPVSVTSIL